MTDKLEWKQEYSRIIEQHDSKVAKGEVELKEFQSDEELFRYLHKQ